MIDLYITITLIVLVLFSCVLCACLLFKFAICKKEGVTTDALIKNLRKKYADNEKVVAYTYQIEENVKDFDNSGYEDVYIESRDNLKLHGYLIESKNAQRTVIFSHGWQSDGRFDFSCIWKFYLKRNFNVLLIDHRSHGKSEGKYITFGIKERFDLIDWIKFINSRFGEDKKVFLSGLSMGSATVMMAIGNEELPENVCGASCDCGFTSPYDEFKHVLKTGFHLPPFPIINIANLISKAVAGFSFNEYSSIESLKNTKIPVVFIHGKRDNFVPFSHTEKNKEACASKFVSVEVDEAEHGLSYVIDEDAVANGLLGVLSEIFEDIK